MKSLAYEDFVLFNLRKLLFDAILLIAAAICFMPVSAACCQADQGMITGTVADSAGAVVSGAGIEARNLETGSVHRTVSTDRGDFSINQLPEGDYELRVSLPGFKQFVRQGISIQSAHPFHIDVTLEIENIRHTITVNAPGPLQLMDHPQREPEALQISVSTIDQLEIEKQGAKTVVDALNYVPGAWVESRGRKVKQFVSLRGQKYPYPEYAVDGALFREFHEVPFFLSTADIERVDILRSSASILQGISGLAGVIDIIPREYEKRETSWLAEYGSLNTYRLHVSHGQKIGKVSFGLGVDGSHTDGPDDRRGAESMVNLFGTATFKPRPALLLRTTIFYLQGRSELVQAVKPAAERFRTERESYDPIQTTVVSVKALYKPRDWASTQFTVGYGNRHNSFVAETDSSRQVTPDYDSEWNLNLIQALALSNSNVVRIGGNYNHWVSPYGKRFYAGRRSELETYSVSLIDEQHFGRLSLDGGVRYQRTYIDEYGAFNIEGSASGFGKVPSIENVWEPGQLSGTLGAAYSLTDTLSLKSSFLTGAIEPRSGTITADGQEPLTEHRIMVDGGFQLVRKPVGMLSLVGFFLRQKNAIVLSGATSNVNGHIMELYENRDQDSKGVEFEFKSRPFLENTNVFFNLTAMKSRARKNGSMFRDTEIPQVIIGAGFLGQRWKFDYNLFWKFVSGYESSRFADPPVPQPLGDFHALNLTVGHSFGTSEKMRIYLEITNLTDNGYSTVVGYPDYGRRFQLGIRQVF
jgi:outer membrane receptor protein involved in Fe transport